MAPASAQRKRSAAPRDCSLHRSPLAVHVSALLTSLSLTPLTPASLLGDVVVIRHGKPFSKRKSYRVQSLDNRPDYPGLPEKSVYVGLANKNAANLIAAQKAKSKRKEEEEAANLSKVQELIKKARL